jgi:hypothetical protein
MRRPSSWTAVCSFDECRRLGDDDVQVAHDAGLVLGRRDADRVARGGDRAVLTLRLRLEQAERGELVLDVLERGEHGLPVVRDALVVGGAGLGGERAALAAVEDRLGDRRAERPDAARPREPVLGVRRLEAPDAPSDTVG